MGTQSAAAVEPMAEALASHVGPGLKAVLNILDKWGCRVDQVAAILCLSRAAVYKYRKTPERASLNQDQIERLSYILNIHAALRTIFENPANVYGFMKLPNHNGWFNGRTPLDIIATGRFSALYETFRRIDALRGGAW